MSEPFLLEIPEAIVRQAQAIAEHSGRSLTDVLTEWLIQRADEPPVEMLPDEQVLALSEGYLPEEQQAELSELLALNREGQLDETTRHRLDELMALYRRGLVRKAQAMRVAVERGLRPRLDEESALM
jgi:hypothetical protein